MKRPSIVLISALFIISFILSNLNGYENAFATTDVDLVISTETLHLREGPGLSYPIVKTLKKNESLTFIEREGEWYHVQVGEQDGWVASWLTSSPKMNRHDTRKTAISQVDQLNVRSEPRLSSSVLTQIHSGQEVEVLESEINWVKISYNEMVGWVSSDYVTVNEVVSEESQNNVETSTNEENVKSTFEESVEHGENSFTITVDEVILRKKPDLSSRPLGSVKKGEQYEVVDRQHNWVKIKYNNKNGWLYNFYGTFTDEKPLITNNKDDAPSSKRTDESIKIIYNGTNIREEPSTHSNVVFRGDAGETYKIVNVIDDWYEVQVNDQTTGFVANWVVSTPAEGGGKEPIKENRKKGTLKGVTIVVDPGHGGNDHGTIGVRGTDEKDVNLKTAELLIAKLKAAGATVISTRDSDIYVDLRKRVSISHQYAADAFISIHHDATEDSSISGITTYYTKNFQKPLADFVHEGLANKVDIRDRGVQSSNLLVLRENKQNAILIELGYLSNPTEERVVTTDYYRQQATLGIYEGILNYFDHLLEE